MTNIQQLRQQARELRQLADTLDAAASGLESLGGGRATESSLPVAPLSRPFPAVAISSAELVLRNGGHVSSAELLYQVIQEANGPLGREEIMEKFRALNREISFNTLQSYLSRDKRLVSVGRGKWTIKDEIEEKGEPPTEQAISFAIK